MKYLLLVLIFFALMFDRLNIFFYLIISALLHETGHIIADIACGYKPRIKVSVFGICLKNYPIETRKKFLVLICGPLVNILLIAASCALLNFNFSVNRYIFMCVNIVLLIFNILPVSFLDGGQLLNIFVSNKKILMAAEIISLLLITVVLFYLTDNKAASLLGISVFLTYYCIKKKDLRF